MEENQNNSGDILMSILGESLPELLITSLDAVVLLLALIFLIMASARLIKNSNVPGVKNILFSLAGYLIGAGLYLVYSIITEGEENLVLEALSSLYFSACIALGAYGLFGVAKFITGVNANKSFKADA